MLADTVVIVTSFERPLNLARSLYALSLQSAINAVDEIVVADDGSLDQTQEVVDHFASTSGLSVTFTTHSHDGFQPGRSRNEAVLASRAPYLIFLDGDCVVDRDFVAAHIARRRQGFALCGDSYRIDESESRRITSATIGRGDLIQRISDGEHRRMRRKSRWDRLYSLFNVPMRPRLTANHFSLWRSDFESVDGFDLGYRGWGLEDRDLQRRLVRARVRCISILPYATSFHLWHCPAPSFIRNARGTSNEAYYTSKAQNSPIARTGMSTLSSGSYHVTRSSGTQRLSIPKAA
jgi:glycosyltransferase involved in cell wall biosynthesis